MPLLRSRSCSTIKVLRIGVLLLVARVGRRGRPAGSRCAQGSNPGAVRSDAPSGSRGRPRVRRMSFNCHREARHCVAAESGRNAQRGLHPESALSPGVVTLARARPPSQWSRSRSPRSLPRPGRARPPRAATGRRSVRDLPIGPKGKYAAVSASMSVRSTGAVGLRRGSTPQGALSGTRSPLSRPPAPDPAPDWRL
jgi:hypothetical protein